MDLKSDCKRPRRCITTLLCKAAAQKFVDGACLVRRSPALEKLRTSDALMKRRPTKEGPFIVCLSSPLIASNLDQTCISACRSFAH
jgi:hypothetical protein